MPFFKTLLLSICALTLANPQEKKLRDYLFRERAYSPNIRPVYNYSQPLEVQQGVAVQTLESFDQIVESLSLNLWIRSYWKDENLRWNNVNDSDIQNIDLLSVKSTDIWTPDTELLNAASKPEIYLLQGGISVYPDGSVFYSKPGIYKSSCSLNLKDFPFDKQNCTLLFSSWVYNDNLLHLIPHQDINKQVDILDGFSHSEWKVTDVDVKYLKEKRDCCPDKEFDLLSYSFIFSRFPHYYRISMGMTITLVVVSFVITLMSPSNVSRTSTAVFIPLTILALQLTIASKIPVVGYYTLMDKFFLCCFVTSMICSIESGLIYAIVSTKSPRFYNFLDRIFKFKFTEDSNLIEENTPESDSLEEFKMVENALEKVAREDNIRMNLDVENSSSETSPEQDERIRNILNLGPDRNINSIQQELENNKSVKKVINYDDKRLFLNARQEKIDELVNLYLQRIDTGIRIILPIVFFSYIIYIFSFDH